MKNPTLYIFKRDGDQCTFVPSQAFSGLMVGMFGAGSLFMLFTSRAYFPCTLARPRRNGVSVRFSSSSRV